MQEDRSSRFADDPNPGEKTAGNSDAQGPFPAEDRIKTDGPRLEKNAGSPDAQGPFPAEDGNKTDGPRLEKTAGTPDAQGLAEAAGKKAQKKDRWWLAPIFAAILAILLNTFILLNARVPSGSMEPTIATGSLMLGDRTAFRRGAPQVGDVVFFRHESEFGRKILVKRVVATAGQTFSMRQGRVYLDGTLLDEPYVAEFSGDDYPETLVPEGCCIVLGDNRTNSNDARYWTDPFIRSDELIARAMFVYFPKFLKFS